MPAGFRITGSHGVAAGAKDESEGKRRKPEVKASRDAAIFVRRCGCGPGVSL